MQADYSNVYRKIQDEDHQDNFASYGYVGKFKSTRIDSIDLSNPFAYEDFVIVDANGNAIDTTYGYLSTPTTVLYEFTRDETNPILANYTDNYYNFYAGDPVGNWQRPSQVQGQGGLLNGDAPGSVYNLWSAMGAQYNQYQVTDQDQLRITTSGSAEIKGHSIKIGFQYEQRTISQYNISPVALWSIGRGLVNTHLNNRDLTEGTFYTDSLNPPFGGITAPNGDIAYAYYFQPKYDGENQTQFDKNIRAKLGMAEKGLDWIDFDSYGKGLWSVSDFSAEDLLNNYSQNNLNYYGFDYAGKKLSGNPSLDDFFNKRDDNGNLTREVGAFKPIYMAGYIQDKFAFEDLIFNIGVRVDRYDANQPVLKDKYSLFPVKTVGEVGNIPDKPSNIGNDLCC